METEILIVGAGMSGLAMGIRLRQAGLDNFLILEQSAGMGGTWYDNRYPGAECDVPSHLYSFSFEKNPDWSRSYAGQPEILGYIERCAEKYGVKPHMRFRRKVVSARFDEVRGTWSVQTEDGRTYTARVLITGCGMLNRPAYPQLPGLASFKGTLLHSARWRSDLPLDGLRVAVVGTGASAVQIVPAIQPRVKQLAVFQRTPNWILPKDDRAYSAQDRARFAARPWLQSMLRRLLYWRMELVAPGFLFPGPFRKIGDIGERIARQFLAAQVRDPVLRAKLTPAYRIGCKRVLLSNDYYAALQRDNTALITSSIAAVTADGITTADGVHHPVDAIVLATGFQASESIAPFTVRGRGGRELAEQWRGGAEAYNGVSIHGFPNLFMLLGPNSGLGHSSMIFMIESQVAYVLGAVRALRARSLKSIEVLKNVQERYNRMLQRRLARSVWCTGGCASWYQTRTGKITTLWPGLTFEFRLRTRRFDAHNYALEPQPSRDALPRVATSGPIRPGILS